MAIRKLPPLLVNQIAAGEVIERPASVVKELVENSLDAGATRIDVAVEDGGRQSIRVADDGAGMPPQDLPLAVAPHATSKLSSAEHLAAIRTLGFRGEALASIASVSRLRLVSRATVGGRVAEAAAALEVCGDQVGPIEPVAGAPGTVVEVRDLFFNTPARRKFLRSASTEFGHVAETLSRIAMVRPEVGFTLRHNDRRTLELAPTASRRQRCLDLLGPELDEAMLEFESDGGLQDAAGGMPDGDDAGQSGQEGGRPAGPRDAATADSGPPNPECVRVWGLAGLPAIARATAKFQHLFVNGRPIRDRNLVHAIREAYRGLVMPDLQPVAVVCLALPFDAVDVNVHPTKAEVRFRDPQRVHGLVLSALRQRLLGADLTPRAVAAPGRAIPSALPLGGLPAAPNLAGPVSATALVDYFRRMDPTQKGFVYEEVKRALAEDDPGLLASSPGPEPGAPAPPAPAALPILQVHRSYVVTQDDEGILIIDQHALHERVMFEELRRRILGAQRLESQRLLMPAVVHATPARRALLDRLRPLLERIGMEVEPIGPDALGVQAFPTFLFDRAVEPAEFLTDLLDRAEEGDLDPAPPAGPAPEHGPGALVSEAVLHEVLDLMACKAAVKAGDKLSPQELAALLAKRQEVERASACPHGRPTTLRLTLRDLERQFKRVL